MPDKIRINMFPAGQGDAFLISCGKEKDKINILIDGGIKDTFKNYLYHFLSCMGKNGEKIDLLIVTHIDNDHIAGIIELFKNNGLSKSPKIIKVVDVWHNAYLQLQFDKQDNITEHQRKVLEEIISKGDGSKSDVKSEISGKQGSKLGSLLYEGIYNWNSCTEGKAIYAEVLPTYSLSKDLSIHILSPTCQCLNELSDYWLDELYNKNYIGKPCDDKLFDDAYEIMLRRIREHEKKTNKEKKILIDSTMKEWNDYKSEIFKEDDKETNRSSFAFIIEFKKKRFLYLGDAAPSIVEKRLKDIYKLEKPPYKFNAVKVSHHGSSGNMSPGLLELIDSPRYLFSTNGSYGHPDLGTLVKIVEHIPNKEKKELIFNYENESERYMRMQMENQSSLNYNTKVSNYEEI